MCLGKVLMALHQASQHLPTLEASHLKAQFGCERVIISYGIHGLIQSQRLGVWRVLVKDGAGGLGTTLQATFTFRSLARSSPSQSWGVVQRLGEASRWKMGRRAQARERRGPSGIICFPCPLVTGWLQGGAVQGP